MIVIIADKMLRHTVLISLLFQYVVGHAAASGTVTGGGLWTGRGAHATITAKPCPRADADGDGETQCNAHYGSLEERHEVGDV